ncbi:MAG TPA: Hsp20/alpha crystallin family protein [Blastocatellia bacterium]|jgi:HSP20 family protein|nr:Hsp20/alpha crystallin family protein [Blastocatellia bacterium]
MNTGTAMAAKKPAQTLQRRWDPMGFFEMPFNRFLEGLNSPFAEEAFPLTRWAPACDIYETPKEVVVKAELPGLKKEDVNVSIENNLLTIYGERKFEEETKKDNYHRVERTYGEFMRSFTLPTFVDFDKINAEFKDGILMLTLPKREEAKPKQIEVKIK